MHSTVEQNIFSEGEEIETEKLEVFLKDNIPELNGKLSILQFPGGHSNLTYLLKVGSQEMVMRCPPLVSKVKSAHDMGREYRVLKALSALMPQVPAPLVYSEDISIIGTPFLIIERINGLIIRKTLPENVEMSNNEMKALCHNIVTTLYELHRIDYHDIGLETFGKPVGYMERQVSGWISRYKKARTPDAPDCEAVMGWLAENIPANLERPAIVHGDFKLDNLVLENKKPYKVKGILDWEMATIGDPKADLAYALIYWPDQEGGCTTDLIPNMPASIRKSIYRDELAAIYESASGVPLGDLSYYYCFNFFRLAAIIQQLYYRYQKGLTKDLRFAAFGKGVHSLIGEAEKIMKKFC